MSCLKITSGLIVNQPFYSANQFLGFVVSEKLSIAVLCLIEPLADFRKEDSKMFFFCIIFLGGNSRKYKEDPRQVPCYVWMHVCASDHYVCAIFFLLLHHQKEGTCKLRPRCAKVACVSNLHVTLCVDDRHLICIQSGVGFLCQVISDWRQVQWLRRQMFVRMSSYATELWQI